MITHSTQADLRVTPFVETKKTLKLFDQIQNVAL